MRKMIGVLVVMMTLAVGGRLAGAQMLDPSTGMMVDATDTFDTAAVMSGQPGNIGTEAMYSAMAQMNATPQSDCGGERGFRTGLDGCVD